MDAQKETEYHDFISEWWHKAVNLKPNERIPNIDFKLFKGEDGYSYSEKADFFRHVYKRHGDPKMENSKAQIAITEQDFSEIPNILKNPSFKLANFKYKGFNSILYAKYNENNTYLLVAKPSEKRKRILTKTFWKMKNRQDATGILENLKNNSLYDISNITTVFADTGEGGKSPDSAQTKPRETVATSVIPVDTSLSHTSAEKSSNFF